MRRVFHLIIVGLISLSVMGDGRYNELVGKVIDACDHPQSLLTAAFTNDVVTYRRTCSNSLGQCAADLALAISLMYRMDHDEECIGNDECYRSHQTLVSNIVYSSSLEIGSWIRYAAAVEYMMGLNFGSRQEAAFAFSTNMVAEVKLHPPVMGATNYWGAMSSWIECPNESIQTVFRLHAATWLAEHNRLSEVIPLTNGLPARAIGIFMEEIR